MSKVFPVQDMFLGTPNGDIQLRAAKGWDSSNPLVKANPHLFTEPDDDDRDAEIERLKAELARVKRSRGSTT
jgi:hypothetical protein